MTGRLHTLILSALLLSALEASAREPQVVDDENVPVNAMARFGIDTVGYPEVGCRQAVRVGLEVFAASAGSMVRHPLPSLARVGRRLTERIGVRIGESTGGQLHGTPVCGNLVDTPFGSPPVPARLGLLPTSESAVQALLAMAETATRRIDLMIYGWEDDPTGREVACALARAAARGVRVRLLVDRGGVLIHNPAAARGAASFLDDLRAQPGVTLIEPGNPFLTFDHRKLAVIDGRVAWSGGMILTEVARRRWENLAFLAEGPVVTQLAALFEERWRSVGGHAEGPVETAQPPWPTPNATVRLVRTDWNERSLKDAIYYAVDHASDHIFLENPYLSDGILTAKLIAARGRGVDVRVVSTMRGNVERLDRYVAVVATRLVRGGVSVYLAPGMTHVKAMTVDGSWAYLGSGNFDELSLRNNREVGLTVSSREVAGALDQTVFLPHMARARFLNRPLPHPAHQFWLELMKLWF